MMNNNKPCFHTSYINGDPVTVTEEENRLVIQAKNSDKENIWQWNDKTNCLSPRDPIQVDGLYAALEFIFNHYSNASTINVLDAENRFAHLIASGLACHVDNAHDMLQFQKDLFWQTPVLWLKKDYQYPYPQKYLITNNHRHPVRPPQKNGIVYQRFIPWLNQTLSFRAVAIEKDLEHFHRWMNDPRVAHFWEENGDIQKHRAYLEKAAVDAHSQSLIGCFDNVPFAYFETYWAKEDRIAPFYEAGDYDRGWHLLVGEEAFRGRQWFSAWFPSLQHYLFLDDPRTQKIVAEPRHDNDRLIKHAQKSGFVNLKAFNFPHKRAQLLMLSRERFFEEYRWQPEIE